MTIDEAIVINQEYLKPVSRYEEADFRDAIKLGEEALKRLADWRAGKVLNPDLLLPGETKD